MRTCSAPISFNGRLLTRALVNLIKSKLEKQDIISHIHKSKVFLGGLVQTRRDVDDIPTDFVQ